MRQILEKYLPTSIFNIVILSGRWVKKKLRLFGRIFKFGFRPFFKKIELYGKSFDIELRPTKNGCVDEIIAAQGVWENHLSQQLIKTLKPGDVFLDIGANIGYHSLLIAAVFDKKISVQAFEPIPVLANQFRASVKRNDFTNISIHDFGLGTEDKEVEIYLRDENMGGSSLLEYKNLNIVRPSQINTIKIKTLDSVILSTDRVNVIKIDIEGYEFEALKGGEQTLRRYRPIIFMEFSPLMYEEDYKGKTQEFITYLQGLGYKFYSLQDESIDLAKRINDGVNTQIDLKCIPIETGDV